MAILAGLFVVISVGAVTASYHAFSKGLLAPLKKVRENASAGERRRQTVVLTAWSVFVVLALGLLIASPFGSYTVAYFIGGFGLFLFVWLQMYVVHLARQTRKSKHG